VSSKRVSTSGQGLSFLVVDDDAAIRDYLTFLLEARGHRVRQVDDGRRVVESLASEPTHFVLLDLMMPEQHGITTLEQIRAVDADVPVIILTGYPETDSAVSALRLRADDYLAKPFQPELLHAAIERVLTQRGLPRTSEEWMRRRLGERLRALRQGEGLSQGEVGERVQLSAAQISQIERAQSSPSLEALHRLSQAFGVTLAELFRGI